MGRGVTLTWEGGEHAFLLPIGALMAVQDACDAGPQEILVRLGNGRWRVQDIEAVLRHGLEGGGLAKADAQKLVRQCIERAGLLALVSVAYRVMAVALTGVEDDPVGEPEGVSPNRDDGASAGSTEPEPSPGSPPETSTQ